jgi:hypothetical protein
VATPPDGPTGWRKEQHGQARPDGERPASGKVAHHQEKVARSDEYSDNAVSPADRRSRKKIGVGSEDLRRPGRCPPKACNREAYGQVGWTG